MVEIVSPTIIDTLLFCGLLTSLPVFATLANMKDGWKLVVVAFLLYISIPLYFLAKEIGVI